MLVNNLGVIFFRLVNFALVAGICGYLFRKRMLIPTIERMADKKRALAEFRYKQHSMRMQAHEIEQQRQEQRITIAHLQDKLMQWNIQTTYEREQRHIQQETIAQTLQSRAPQRQQALRDYYLQKQAAPHIIQMVTTAVRNQYNQPQAAESVIAKIITYMSESDQHHAG